MSASAGNIPWWNPQIGAAELDLVRQVLESNYVNEGEFTERFEKRIAGMLGVKHALATTSGTAAIYLSLKAVGVGVGDEVIVPDVTFIATANAVEQTGAVPVLADIDEATLNIDPKAAERAITTRTKAIVPVHVSGRGADMQALCGLAERHGLHIVEDAAEALLSKHRGRYLGTWGRLGCFSFSPNKTITTGQGGLIVSDDDSLVTRLRELKDQGRPVRGTGGDDIHRSVGYNFKLTNLQAAVGLGQLELLPARVKRICEIHRTYAERLAGLPGLRLPGFDLAGGEVPQWTDAVAADRDGLDKFLAARKMGCRRFWHPLHSQTPYKRSDEAFPVATRLMRQAIWLPSAFTMIAAEQEQVCAALRQFLSASR